MNSSILMHEMLHLSWHNRTYNQLFSVVSIFVTPIIQKVITLSCHDCGASDALNYQFHVLTHTAKTARYTSQQKPVLSFSVSTLLRNSSFKWPCSLTDCWQTPKFTQHQYGREFLTKLENSNYLREYKGSSSSPKKRGFQ